jgi:hypothetical protein
MTVSILVVLLVMVVFAPRLTRSIIGAKPRPAWKTEAEEWLKSEGYFSSGKYPTREERAVHDKMAKGAAAFNNPQETWIDSFGNVRTDW